METILWNFLILYQFFILSQVKRSAITSNKEGVYELLNVLRLRISGIRTFKLVPILFAKSHGIFRSLLNYLLANFALLLNWQPPPPNTNQCISAPAPSTRIVNLYTNCLKRLGNSSWFYQSFCTFVLQFFIADSGEEFHPDLELLIKISLPVFSNPIESAIIF